MENFSTYILLYYGIMLCLLFITIRKYFKLNYLLIFGLFTLYLLAIILSIIGFFNDINLINIDNNTMNYLDELDFSVELPEIYESNEIKTVNDNNFISKFLYLFNNNAYCPNVNIKFNSFNYIDSYTKDFELDKLNNMYRQTSVFNNEILTFIDSFMDILNDLESIQKSLNKEITKN